MKHYFPIMLFCLLILGSTGCSTTEPPLDEIAENLETDDNLGGNTEEDLSDAQDLFQNDSGENATERNPDDYEYIEDGIIDPETAESIIKDTSDGLINALKSRDMEAVSEYIHPEEGVRFTPYTFVSPGDDIVFTKEEIRGFFDNPSTYQWGSYDGYGNVIEMTTSEFFEEYVFNKDFTVAEEVGYNTILSGGNTLNNHFEVYENPIVVEYYFSGFDPELEGMDWQSLSLIFEEYDDTWYLVGIVHNQHTI